MTYLYTFGKDHKLFCHYSFEAPEAPSIESPGADGYAVLDAAYIGSIDVIELLEGPMKEAIEKEIYDYCMEGE